MASAGGLLADSEHGIVRLFTPPFAATPREPGYIKAYPPGVRENGGQYSHAAAWYVLALARMGRGDDAWQVLSMMLPTSHSRSQEAADLYRVEPYVVAADIYGAGDKTGRGGWTWYTGSAGWFYRAAVEGILGITREGTNLRVAPALPDAWPGFEATCRVDGSEYRIVVRRTGMRSLSVDGKLVEDGLVPLSKTNCAVEVTL